MNAGRNGNTRADVKHVFIKKWSVLMRVQCDSDGLAFGPGWIYDEMAPPGHGAGKGLKEGAMDGAFFGSGQG